MSTTTQQRIDFKRINNDVNGNPRYVCHYSELLTDKDKEELPLTVSPTYKVNVNLSARYERALKRAKEIGGRKFHNKQYGGGIVFQSYNIKDTENQINDLLK
jgi:hypothetical protein